jgi:hypothetical protein
MKDGKLLPSNSLVTRMPMELISLKLSTLNMHPCVKISFENYSHQTKKIIVNHITTTHLRLCDKALRLHCSQEGHMQLDELLNPFRFTHLVAKDI